ncbi:ATP-dependent protease ClpP, protease subunit [Paraburkholderia fungorum]|uniref:ATP-dependent Clp protease proteolytic subunit n=1 Tax=Paraburkholderia fungorum TaxID=134537 RepID=A0A1H1H1P2_9BURK|nr:head maturation protease, ClpP-related [Paraburkholderia fungorum]SDR18998.1 ATP-dependent protease ClpP, protease subunit [Paraburkholderia fungorum]
MSLLQLPEIRADFRLGAAQFDMRPDALERWEPEVRAANDGSPSISIYDTIGDNWEGTGVTATRISAALRSIGANQAVTVNVNSPGGDFFEGVAIYNLLRQHQAKVTVQVLGLAASAASVIAMAGDEILMGEGSFLMIHNAWTVAIGNRHDLAQASQTLEPFDSAMANLYAKRAGITQDAAASLMDKETWIGADQAVSDGFATGLIESAEVSKTQTSSSATRKTLAIVEASMAKAGYSRSTRREAIKSLLSGTPSAAGNPATPSAGEDVAETLQNLLNAMKG